MKKSSKCLIKRTLSVVLACVMVLSLFPTVAFAARLDREVAEIPAVDEAAAKLAESPAEPLEANAELAAVGARTYYVSLSGKGGNSGLSEAEPLPGLDAVPWNQLLPGDSVLLKKGDTFPGAIRMVGVHGTEDAPVTIGAYGTGSAPVIEARGQGIWLPETGNDNGRTPGKYVSSGIALYDCSYVTVSGLTIVNVPDAMKTSFTYEDGTDYSSDKMVYSGIGVAADGVGTSEGITLEGITVRGNSDLVAVKTDTSSTISTSGVTTGVAAAARTYTNASGTYYVSSLNGSDSNDGSTPDKAFYSLHKINELNLQPGAKVYLEYGSVFENQYLHVNGGGVDGNPAIIDAYGKVSSSKPVINTNGEGVWYQNYRKNLDNAGHLTHGYVSSSILLYDVPFIEVKNIAMTNFGRYGETPGADFANLGSYDGGTVPGETGYGGSAGGAGNKIGCYQWGGKMSRTGVAGVAQNMGTVTHTVLQNLDIENIYGNIVYKHMNNGGIYFTAARPLNTNAGIARFDDIVIEGCYLKRVSRWGIAAVHTAYWHELSPNGQWAIPDARCQQYGATNVYIGHNYLEEVGGDPITAMHAYEPFVEYNVAYNGGREMSSSATSNAVYINGTYFSGNSGDVSAGIWPWKCKTALFEHNECYTMLYSHLGGNNDAQPWDADSGDSTIYQYNYSSGNTGGCIMFCGGDAYNTVFRYNISYKDGKPWAESNPQNGSTRRGILDPSGSRNGQFTNNTFIMAEGTPVYHYTSGSRHTVRNNIFFNLGNEYAPEGGWTAASGLAFSKNIYVGFAQNGAGSYTTKDTDYTTLTKTDLFADPTFTGAPEAPKTTSKSGARTVNGVRDWTHDWASEFDMFKIADGNKANVANKGAAHDYDGLAQDSNFGVPRVANDKDFYGNELDEVHDIGAFDTQTDSVPTPSSEYELISSLYELRGTNSTELQVPYTANNPTSVEEFKKGLTVSEGASVKVYNGTDEVTTGNVLANMTVRIVAADGVQNPTVYTIKQKNTYNSYTDWVGNHQGNAWFYQYWDGSRFVNHTSWDSSWSGWGGVAPGFASVEKDQACGSINAEAGSGFTFRAPVGGKVTVKYHNYKNASAPVENQVQKRLAATSDNTLIPSVRVYVNGVEQSDKTVVVDKTAAAVTTTEMTFTVDQGDTLSFMAYNAGPFTNNGGNNGIYFTPVITYLDEAYAPGVDTTAPTVPGALAVTKVTQTGATLTWTASSDNRGVTGYKVKVGNAEEETVTALTKVLTGLTAGTQYTVTVKAVDEAGNESAAATANFTTLTAPVVDTVPPAAPTDGAVKGTPTATTAALQWAASSSDDVACYEITVDNATETVRNITQVTLTGLTAETGYTASVVAVDAAGNKSAALTVTFTTGAADAQAPTAPAEVEVQGITSSQATLRWSPATDNVAVAGYQIKLGEDGTVIDVGNVLQYAFTGLNKATQYTAFVAAYDEAGNLSSWTQCTFSTSGSNECALVSSLFEIRDTNQLQVPYTDHNPVTAAQLAAGLTISEFATVQIKDASGSPVSDNTSVAQGMTVQIVAEDGTVNPTTYTIAQKNTYNSFNDWVDGQQGNVWFYQYEENDVFFNHSTFGGYQDWNSGKDFASVEKNQACGSTGGMQRGSGFTFRAPVGGNVRVNLNYYTEKTASAPTGENKVAKRASTTDTTIQPVLHFYINGVEVEDTAVNVPKDATPVDVEPMGFTLNQGDTLSVFIRHEGPFTNIAGNQGVYFNPTVTYLDEAFVPGPSSITLDQSELTLYTNTTETAQLTATILPAEADQTVTWTSGNTDVVTVSDSGLVTAVGNGDTYICATAAGSQGGTVTTTCQIHVRTRMETITVKQGGTAIGSDPIKLYTNEGDNTLTHTVTLTADITPANVSNPALNWTRPDGAAGRLTITRNSDGSATLTATTNELNVGPVTVRVASAEHMNVKTTFTVHVVRMLKNPVTISGAPKFGETLSVDLNQLSMSVIGKNGLTYQWKRDGEAIQNATAQDYTLTTDDIGAAISVEVTPGDETFYEGVRTAAITGTVSRGDNHQIPTGLTAVNCTSDNDGRITGLDATKTYEYKLEGAADWTPVDANADAIEGLSAGNYLVRFAQTTTHEAGTNAATVTILAAGVSGHTITATVTPSEGGVITVASQAAKETEVALTVAANPGYTLKAGFPKVTYTNEEGAEQTVVVAEGKFTMPDANVTVTAEFEKVKFTLTHALEHISCDQVGEHAHEVEYGDTPTINLTADEGYTMPASITIVNAADEMFTGYRYNHTVAEPDKASIIFTQPITEALTVRGVGEVKTYVVNYTLTNGLSAPEENAPRQASYRELYQGTLVAAEGYALPETIVVTVGGSLIGAENFSYNNETGLIRIIVGQINGNVVITASGVKNGESIVSVTGVALNLHRTNLKVGGSVTLIPTIAPDNATNQTVAWATSDENVATVDEDGVVTAVAEGTATITVMTLDGRHTATCELTVTKSTSGGGSTSSGSSTTKTETRDDGSKVTTVTKPDGTVTETVTQPDGTKSETVTTKDGDVTITVTDPNGEELVKAEIPATIPEPETKFEDVDVTPWAEEAIHKMAGLELVNGTGGNKYSPVAPMTRGSLATVLHRLSQGKTDYETTFKDVAQGKYYTEGVAWAAKAKVVTGYSEDIFAPDDVITREQLAVMLARYAKLVGMDTKADVKALEAFADGENTGSWATDGVAWCVANGILKGKGQNNLDPTAKVTRAEVAVMLDRFIALIQK